MAYLNRDGVRLYYEVHGSGPTILLTHGYSATAQMWHGQRTALAAEYQLVVWDMRGHGRTETPDEPGRFSVEETIADMAALMDAVEAPCAIVGGLSLGGYMSLAFHLAHADRVRGLMVFDTGPGYRSDRGRQAWNDTAEQTASNLENHGLSALQSMSAEVATAMHGGPTGLIHAARGMLKQTDAGVIDSLPGIAVPTLVLVGEKDEPFRKAADYMGAKIPGADKVVLAGAGHAANMDRRRAFNEAVLDFLHARLPV